MQNNEGYHKAKQTKKTNNKKAIALVCLALVVVCICAVVTKQSNEQTQLIRIHIRANSNSAPDQTVKLKVRDQITEYLTVELGGV
ncbi:MAG: stage II sporulation protein R, partial [Firmicutes bacterium]|nr:stage II sporulation protein R [Bacillota bacterium]